MKIYLFTFFLGFALAKCACAQDITGQWNGALKIQGTQLRIVFHISKTETGYSATMDSPDQNAKGIPISSVSFDNSKLTIVAANLGLEYEGLLKPEKIIEGTFKQGGMSIPLNLTREAIEKKEIVRPQDPKRPYPYYEEEVSFRNDAAGIKLAGTLTLPKNDGVFPAVVLITGSGAQNRNEELMGHKPFLIIADFLTRNGIAVLRFDDRGTALSEGDFKIATTNDFATDVNAAVRFLLTRKEIDKKKIGLIGHSEGGIIAPIVAGNSKDVSFIVLLAGTGIPGDQILLMQQELIGKASGMSDEKNQAIKKLSSSIFELVEKSNSVDQLTADLTSFVKQELKNFPERPQSLSDDDFVKVQVKEVANPWMMNFIKYDPAAALGKVKCPVLALNGEKDLQVPPKENLSAIRDALTKGGNKKVTAIELPGLNHLFQECNTGAPSEYGSIDQTFSPVALNEILKWIKNQTK